MKKIIVNIDYDGVLINNNVEQILTERLNHIPIGHNLTSLQSEIFNWYVDVVNHLPTSSINTSLLNFFAQHRDKYVLRLWTNRQLGLKHKTLEELHGYQHLFDTYQFYEGDKYNSKVEGIVIDNDPKYLRCGQYGGILHQFLG
jgi:hypothetical protein